MELSRKIKALREARGMSLQELSQKSGITASYLFRLESGQKDNPSDKTLSSLSKVLEEDLTFTRKSEAIQIEEFVKLTLTFEGRELKEEEKEVIYQEILKRLT